MNILFLAPQPFYEDRGTPIAVNMVLKVLSQRGDHVDLITYHIGKDVHYDGLKIHRIINLPFIREIPPGFSFAKVICDIVMFFKVLSLVKKKRYQLVHAVEDAVFIALVLKLLFKIPYVFDMDSDLIRQMIDQYPLIFSSLSPLLFFLKGIAVKNAKVVVPVCDTLSLDIEKYESEKVMVLWDVSLLDNGQENIQTNLKENFGADGLLLMYVGNLEKYQGIDLLLESFSLVLEKTDRVNLVIIGGKENDISKYQLKAQRLNIGHKVQFLGPKPIKHLEAYLSQADILVSPRVKGNNTPMKVFSYLGVGKALMATDLPTHTQVLNNRVSVLAEPNPKAFAEGLMLLIRDKNLRSELGSNGKKLIAERHSYEVFYRRLNSLYDWLDDEVDMGAEGQASPFERFLGNTYQSNLPPK
jgi:glycosyltransferase involved in cell wall biosynthesis